MRSKYLQISQREGTKKIRYCLKCEKKFESISSENRLCSKCRDENEHASSLIICSVSNKPENAYRHFRHEES